MYHTARSLRLKQKISAHIIWPLCHGPYQISFQGDNEFQQENLNACISKNEKILGDCILECKGDPECKNDCVSQFENNYSECPCQVILYFSSFYNRPNILFKEKCPYGCPCDGYECEIFQKKSVLVLYTRENTNQPVLIRADGQFSTQEFLYKTKTKCVSLTKVV